MAGLFEEPEVEVDVEPNVVALVVPADVAAEPVAAADLVVLENVAGFSKTSLEHRLAA